MATGTRLMQEISDQFLNCKICFENFRDPKTLSCLHTFCCTCLQNQYEQEVSSRATRYTISIYNRQVTCPLCRKKTDLPTGGVKRLPDNFLVSNLTEVLAKRTVSKVPPCEICPTVRGKNIDACSKCLDCSKILCKSCVDMHLSTKVTQQHSLIDLEGEKDIQCKAHPDEYVRFYCEPCDACICVVCAFQEHKDHEVCSFSDGSAKYRSNLESLVGQCKERLDGVVSRLNAIEKYEAGVKDVKDRVRDFTISFIAQVRAKEKELMKQIEDEYGRGIKDFVDHKQMLQENMDELQSTCNLTSIMLKDKSVELLLIKKDIESKMTQLLQPVLPEMPADPNYDIRLVPEDVKFDRPPFGGDISIDCAGGKENQVPNKRIKLDEVDGVSECLSQTNGPDVITDTTLTEKCRTKEMSTSMLSDMRGGFAHTNSQTEAKSLISRDTSTNLVETRERGVFAKVFDMKARGTMTERSDVRSLKCQTELGSSKETQGDTLRNSAGQGNRTASSGCGGWKASSPPTSSSSSSVLSAMSVKNRVGREINTAAAAPPSERIEVSTTGLGQSTSRGDCRPAPDLLPTSAALNPFVYTPGRRIRSIKIQTEISSLDVNSVANSADIEFINNIVQSQILAEKRQEMEKSSSRSLFRDRPRRLRTESGPAAAAVDKLSIDRSRKETSSARIADSVACQMTSIETQTERAEYDDSSTCTNCESLIVKATSTQAVIMDDKETSTLVTKYENKVTWTDLVSTSERATSTIATKSHDRSTDTMPIKTGDIGLQIKPYCHVVATNTTQHSLLDQDSQTTIETTEQGTVPDMDIQMLYEKKEAERAKEKEVMESSVDFITPPQSPMKPVVKTVDRATDPIKTPYATKATETVKTKMVTSSTETHVTKFMDKDTATSEIKTIDQWTETPIPQLISTGVTPPIPATIDVGVATNVVLTDEQATSTDVKAYRDTHTETVVVLCDNETLTEVTKYSDAQTSVDISTDNQECETDKMDNADEGCMTEYYTSWESVKGETQSPQYETRSLPRDHIIRRRRRTSDTQTRLASLPCASCGHMMSDTGQCNVAVVSSGSLKAEVKPTEDHRRMSGKAFKDSSTMPRPSETQDVGTMAISCVTCQHELQETAIQTSQPVLYDKASATSFENDLDFLERALSRDYQDAATSTESLPYIGLLSEIDVDELIVVPEAAFELVSDTESEHDLIMVDDETITDVFQSVEVGTQTVLAQDEGASHLDTFTSMTESSNSKCIGEVIKSMVQSQGIKSENGPEGPSFKHVISVGVNTLPKLTFDKETCTPIRHLFSKGTMTFFVSKMDKSTSTLNQARIITSSSLNKAKSVDKVTMTAKAEKKDVGIETEATAIDGRITKCISKLRSVSEKLNSPPAKKVSDNESFFGTNFSPSKVGTSVCDKVNAAYGSCTEKPEEERQRQLKTLLEQTNAFLKSKDRSPIRKPQPITTLKCRKPATLEKNSLSATGDATAASSTSNILQTDCKYDSRSLPRGFPSDRPGTVRMGSQPLSPSRLPLLRYNSAPGRIATVPTQTLLIKTGQTTPAVSPSASRRVSPSKIPICKKLSPPDFQVKLPLQQQQQQQQQQPHQKQQQQQLENVTKEPLPGMSPLRRPLPSITETRTPSSCSDSSTASYMSAESNSPMGQSSNRLSSDSTTLVVSNRLLSDSATHEVPNKISTDSAVPGVSNRLSTDLVTPGASNRLSTDLATSAAASNRLSTDSSASVASNRLSIDSTTPKSASSPMPGDSNKVLPSATSNRLSVDSTAKSRSPSTCTTLSVTSTSLTDSVFKKSLSDVSHSADSSDTLEDKSSSEDKTVPPPPKKSGMGFMQRLLSRKKKAPEVKKEPVSVIKSGPPTAAAVAALASAGPPLPAAAPESYAHTPLQLPPPHHYPPLPEHSSPSLPRKPRSFVYVQQRIVPIQQDNVEEMEDRKTKGENPKSEETKHEQASGKDKKKEKEKLPDKQKDKAKKDAQAEKEKKKKEEKEKSKAKAAKTTKIKNADDKNNSPVSSKKLQGAETSDKK